MKFFLPILFSFLVFLIGANFLEFNQSILLAIIVLLVAFWSNEALPIGVVSLFPLILFPLFGILDLKLVAQNYSKTIIFLFLGGFMVAIAVEKIGLHQIIANRLISIFPNSARGLIFALSITSATLSAFLSNTTTALLLIPVALFLTNDLNLKSRLILAVAYGASIGGIITPIGTPPNLLLFGFLDEHNLEKLTFVGWMFKMFPLALLMLIVVSYILSIGTNNIKVDKFGDVEILDKDQKRLSLILILLILALFINSFVKLSDTLILLSFGLLMFFPKVGFLTWEDTKKIPYEIIFLFGAGFAIANAFIQTGLASKIADTLILFNNFTPFFILLFIGAIITFSTEITSNTALTSIALPVIYELGEKLQGIDISILLMVSAICASYAFMLPIATPPNAIAMSSGGVKVKTMAKYGFMFNIIAIILTSFFAYFYW